MAFMGSHKTGVAFMGSYKTGVAFMGSHKTGVAVMGSHETGVLLGATLGRRTARQFQRQVLHSLIGYLIGTEEGSGKEHWIVSRVYSARTPLLVAFCLRLLTWLLSAAKPPRCANTGLLPPPPLAYDY